MCIFFFSLNEVTEFERPRIHRQKIPNLEYEGHKKIAYNSDIFHLNNGVSDVFFTIQIDA